ncbi:hypothetical protein AAHV29_23100 [Klebsiella variicola subsp. variicola]|uniref:hypothetical protein n=1 Tax=Enterobacteriaceae TaxID=543 RepID=UPI000A0FEBC9|nr:hypothetical protein [Cronobacter malonaticus]
MKINKISDNYTLLKREEGVQGSFSNIPKTHSDELRLYCVSVRFNKKELEKVEKLRGHYRKSEWLRLVSLSELPPIIPEINKDAWRMLGEISQKINRLLVHLDSKSNDSPLTKTEAFAVKKLLHEFRVSLIASHK